MFTCNMCGIDCNCVSNNPYENNIYMKENEMPEKVIHNGIEYYRVDIIEDVIIDGEAFVKKDAFIEKACEFLKSCRQEIYNGEGYIAGIVNDKTIEDFRKYME